MSEPGDDDEDGRHAANIAVLIAVVVIIGLALLVIHYISGNLATERCIEERRHDCGDTAQ